MTGPPVAGPRAPDPLRATLSIARRWRALAPVWLVQSIVTALLICLLTPTNSFRETTLRNLRALEVFTAVTPANALDFDSTLTSLLEANPAAERRLSVRIGWLRYGMLVGETICPLILADSATIEEVLERAAATLAEGRLPRGKRAEVAVHQAVAKAKGLRIGDRTGPVVGHGDVDGEQFEVVGLLRGPGRLAVGSLGTGLSTLLLRSQLPHFALVYAAPGRKQESDAYLHRAENEKSPAFDVVDRAYVEERTAQALKNLPILVSTITLITASAVALVVMLLNVIQFAGRADEFAMLLAIGHRRARLARRLAMESALVGGGAWLTGVAFGLLTMLFFDRWILSPLGIAMRVVDLRPLLLSVAVPILATATSVAALWRRLSILDPLSIIDRRFA